MRKIYSIVLITALFASCGPKEGNKKSVEDVISGQNLKEITAKKEEIMKKYDALYGDISKLEIALSKLDTAKVHPIVTSFLVKEQPFKHYIRIQGDVGTKENIIIYPETAGVLKKVFVTEGQKVTKGQTLAVIDDGGLSQQLAQLEVQTALAKTTFERQEKLWNQKIGSEIQFLQAKSNYEAQLKAIEQLKVQLAKNTIKAPITGVIDDIITEQGNMVSPGQVALMRIINLNNMYIKADVPEVYLSSIKKGSEVEVELPAIGEKMISKVRQVGNYINPNNRTFTIEVAITNKTGLIKPNLNAILNINDYTNSEALVIPNNIIQENAEGSEYVYVAEGTSDKVKVKRILVETGKQSSGLIEITSGLKKGDRIIDEGSKSMREGLEVIIK